MTLPKVQGAGFQEIDIRGCPVVIVGGLRSVALWRVAEYLGVPEKEAARRLAGVTTGRRPEAAQETGS